MINLPEIFASKALEKVAESIWGILWNKGVRPFTKDSQSDNSAGEIKALSDAHRKIVKDFTSTAPRGAKVTIDTYQKGASLRAHVKWDARQKQKNFTNTFRHASQNLSPKILDRPLDYRWLARFGSIVIDTSDEAIQEIFGKILAGELENPGSISLSTLDVLSKMTKADAENFARFANYVLDGEWIYVNPFGVNAWSAAGDLSMSNYMDLLNLGLFNESATGIARSMDTADLGLSYPVKLNSDGCLYLKYMNRVLKVKPIDRAKERGYTMTKEDKVLLPALLLSRTGRELVKFVKQEFQESCLEYMATGLHRRMESDVYVADIDADASYEDITEANFEKIQFVGDKAE